LWPVTDAMAGSAPGDHTWPVYGMVAETAGILSDNAAAMADTPIAPERIHTGLFVGDHLRMRTPLARQRARSTAGRPAVAHRSLPVGSPVGNPVDTGPIGGQRDAVDLAQHWLNRTDVAILKSRTDLTATTIEVVSGRIRSWQSGGANV
jgi:hypothetical protein